MAQKVRKYQPENLIRMFRIAAELRRQMVAEGFTDNGGAIHSAERILNILGMSLKYPTLTLMNNLRNLPDAEFSKQAKRAYARGERVFIEHVAPHRALTKAAIAEIENGASDEEFSEFVKSHFRLVLLTEEETRQLNKRNRSKIDSERLAGIKMAPNGRPKPAPENTARKLSPANL